MNRITQLIVVCFLLLSCNQNKQLSNKSLSHSEGNHDQHQHHQEMDYNQPTDLSIYNLESKWITQNGDEIKLLDLSGKVLVMALVYTHCTYACPRIVADIQLIQSKIEEDHADKVGFVLVTIDPDRDTPERLKAFARENNFDPETWTLLQGQHDDILELAALLGVKYKKTTDTDFAHSNMITVLNNMGEIVHQQIGLGTDPEETMGAINRTQQIQLIP